MSRTVITTPTARLRMGLGSVDITPPSDSYHRNWGAALHDAAEGIHRPLRATAAVFAPLAGGDERVFVVLDLGWLRTREMEELLAAVSAAADLPRERLTVSFIHTHAAINLDLSRTDEPGGRRIAPYLEELPKRICAAIEKGRAAARPVELTFAAGHCDLAMQRDYWDEERRLFACGPNPEGTADDRVWVVRATDEEGRAIAYVVNYACHPTTLAWENRLISPDYIGATRALIEERTGAEGMFLLGPCGDLGPKEGFVGDPEVADRNGRQLGYAALQVAESMPPAGTEMRYAGPVISGATLGIWERRPLAEERRARCETVRSIQLEIELPFKSMPPAAELEAGLEEWGRKEADARAADRELEVRDCRARIERLRRALRRLEGIPDSGVARYRIQLTQLGEGVLIGVGGEPYNLLQRSLRARFSRTPLLIAVLCNQPHSYILPEELCGRGHYQDECSLLAPGALERIEEAIATQLSQWGCR